MRFAILALILAHTGCKSIECATGTIERDGKCEPADFTTGTAKCGPFTELQGDQCVPMFPPTVCDPSTTTTDVDPTTGVTTCIGNGTGGNCSGAFACPAPAAGKQSICGQIYNFEDNAPFAATGANGTKCPATPASSGPCALQVQAYDAFAYAGDPTNTPPLSVGTTYVDDCGRYRLTDITVPAGPFIAVGIDDAGMPFGPAGVTNTTGVATPSAANKTVKDFEAWVVTQSTTTMWENTGGPPLSGGIYVGVFRSHKENADGTFTGDPFATSSGVTFTKSGVASPSDDYYFMAETTHQHVDAAATLTSTNGTVLYTNASVSDGLVYSGDSGGITDTTNCQWDSHAAASLPNIVFFQIYRPVNKPLHQCAQ
jgi:hypothetical protein